jgi:predicted  nucleic acid-binding Zn-ribbon protein
VQTFEVKEIMNAPKKEYTERIAELETEIEDLKQLIATFESSVSEKVTIKNQETSNELLEKLSVMLLYKNVDDGFFSEKQKILIRSLFGDYATTTYKDKIKKLEQEISNLNHEKARESKELKHLLEKNL